ncbi:14-3-3 protein zeta/delta-like [Dreissena polymorpha]|uniref:14-3-3 domain-containing protein n=1 Tax=Dreissena polymorpha TaxID=45954 RepID=A0A9D4C9D4_DREPO|nr:14-3-3 protein zeta/delta-like [Dreissena polymorpha]KAH3719446.1 hypothetical protein DPMN_062281 [Dreissena polymorpha]
MPSEREVMAHKAQLCELSGRYHEMVDVMRDLVASLPVMQKLNAQERKLLAVAYKNEIAHRRKGLKTINKLVGSPDLTMQKRTIVNDYKAMLKQEMRNLCEDLIKMLNTKLLPGINEPESDIFFHKMKGDYYRYLCETEEDEVKLAVYIGEIRQHYQVATEYAERSMAATHPLRLGLAMNYSVFINEMLDNRTEARDHAKRFYDQALDEMESVREVDIDKYNECAYLLKLLHDNIKVWTTEPDRSTLFLPTQTSHFAAKDF